MSLQTKDKQAELAKAKDQLGQLAWLMDDLFKVPGINWRFGLDFLIGLIPGGGDLLTGAMGMILLMRAFQFRLPGIIILRMVLNTLIDFLIGSIPVLGDLFDFAWKSNSKNMKLFQHYAQTPEKSTMRHWIFLFLIGVLFVSVFVGVSAAVYLLLRKLI